MVAIDFFRYTENAGYLVQGVAIESGWLAYMLAAFLFLILALVVVHIGTTRR